MRSFRGLVVVLAALSLVAAACGDDDDPALEGGSPDGGESVTVVGENISFDTTQLTAAAGDTLQITFDNRDDGTQHNFHVRGNGVDEMTEIAEGPVTQELEVTFDERGEYDFLCDVHPDQMQGTITVE